MTEKRCCAALDKLVEDFYKEAKTLLNACLDINPEPIDPDPIDPEPIDPTPGDFNALACADNSVLENKRLRIPAIQSEREPRQPVGTIGDVTRSDWNEGDGDLLKEHLNSIVPQGYPQWSSNLHKKVEVRPGKYTWRNIGVRPGEGARQLKWGTREYNAPFRSFIDCDFVDIPREHGLYVSNYEGTLVENCTFLRCGSQGVQFAHRPLPYQQYDADTLPYASKPEHVVRGSHFVDNAFKGDRPSFNLTYFNPGTSEMPGKLLVEDCSFVCDWPETRADGKKSSGAMVVSNQQGNEPLAGQNMMESVTLRNCLFDFTKGDRAIVSLMSVDEILIEDCCFIARDHSMPNITIDKEYGDALGGTKTKRIIVRNTVARGGVRLNLMLAKGADGKQSQKFHSIDCPGEELVFDGITGDLISKRKLS